MWVPPQSKFHHLEKKRGSNDHCSSIFHHDVFNDLPTPQSIDLSGDSAGRHFQRLDPRSWTASEGIDLEIGWKLRKMHGISMGFHGVGKWKVRRKKNTIIQNPMVDGRLGWNVAWQSLIGKRLDLLSAAGIILTCSGEPYRLHSTELQWNFPGATREKPLKNFDSGTPASLAQQFGDPVWLTSRPHHCSEMLQFL